MTQDGEGVMHAIRIGGETAEFLVLTVHGRRLPDSADYWDGNWLNCDVEVAAGAFRGALGGTIRNEDLMRFRGELARLHDQLLGAATLEALEGWICLDLVGDGRGHLEAKGRVCDDPVRGNSLEFRLDLDQSHLPALTRQMDEACRAYPVIGQRTA
jgi:hypothetical protein